MIMGTIKTLKLDQRSQFQDHNNIKYNVELMIKMRKSYGFNEYYEPLEYISR